MVTRVYIGRDYQGEPAYMSEAGADWHKWYKAWMKIKHPDIDLAIIQAMGNSVLSGNTHSYGYAFDWDTYRLTHEQQMTVIQTSRRFGASATYVRDGRDSKKFGPHIHSALDAGPGVQDGCHWQIESVKRGMNALTYERPDRYKSLNPVRWVTLYEGIQMMKQELEDDLPSPYDVAKSVFNDITFGPETYGQYISRMQTTVDDTKNKTIDIDLRCQDLERANATLRKEVADLRDDLSAFTRGIYDPENPLADSEGYVSVLRWFVSLRDEIRKK